MKSRKRSWNCSGLISSLLKLSRTEKRGATLSLPRDFNSLIDLKKIDCSIITIGDELLIGQTQDTNSAWMARALNEAGIGVRRRVAIGDDREAILVTLREEAQGSEILLITGGLGPTSDDITKAVLLEFFGSKLIVDEPLKQKLVSLFKARGLPILERNLLQASVPDNCLVIPNTRGTAPGMWFEKDGRIFVSMPGVPLEMVGMMTDEVLPRLKRQFQTPEIIHRTLITSGMGESFVSERLIAFEESLPAALKLAYLPSDGFLKLRLTGMDPAQTGLRALVDQAFSRMSGLLADIQIATEDISMAELVGRLLKERNATVGTAESCTGGYIAHQITLVPGSSAYYRGSIVSYDNSVKTDLLQVDPEIIQKYGAVSEETVKGMADGALRQLKTDYAVAVTGIMGPDGGTKDKPVGTVWVSAAGPRKLVTRKFQLSYDRVHNIQMAGFHALQLLVRMLSAK